MLILASRETLRVEALGEWLRLLSVSLNVFLRLRTGEFMLNCDYLCGAFRCFWSHLWISLMTLCNYSKDAQETRRRMPLATVIIASLPRE